MSLRTRILARGRGWSVSDVVCGYGPQHRPFEETHDAFSVAAVLSGTFQYRTTQGSAVLAPGSVLLGNCDQSFACGHDHSTGDRCLAFHIEPQLFEAVASDVGTRCTFRVPCLPPLASLAPLLATAEVARDEGDASQLEELTMRMLGAVSGTLRENDAPYYRARKASALDIRRVSEALRWIEVHSEQPLTLEGLAGQAAMSPFHFLRTFRSVAGVTPYQYVLRMRLRRACVALRCSDESVAAVAFRSGFSDLATFNRQFRRMAGVTPTRYRLAKSARIRPVTPDRPDR